MVQGGASIDLSGAIVVATILTSLVWLVSYRIARSVPERPRVPLSMMGDFPWLPHEARQRQNSFTGGRGGKIAAGAQTHHKAAIARHGRASSR